MSHDAFYESLVSKLKVVEMEQNKDDQLRKKLIEVSLIRFFFRTI